MLIDGKEINFTYAEEIIVKLKENDEIKNISSTKLRALLEPVNHLYSKVQQRLLTDLTDDIIYELEYIKVKFAYEAGRESSVKRFINKTYLNEMLERVIAARDKATFIYFCRYFESLVAYAKFHGMGD